VAFAVVALLGVLLPPQPENAIAIRTAPTATGPAFIARSLAVRSVGDLPALGVVDDFDQFSGAADPALTVLSRV
jgi:hypothetical protein